MGNCASQNKKPTALAYGQAKSLRKILDNVSSEIIKIHDLASRISDHQINLQNFRMFFEKNGLWGQKLFKQFDLEKNNLLSCNQFMRGIARLFKTSERQKIRLLFSFFAQDSSKKFEGITFNSFLRILYNYPKQDLKQIINDSDFFSKQLKKHLYSLKQNRRIDSILPSGVQNGMKDSNGPIACRVDEQESVDRIPSTFGKNILANLKNEYKDNGTSINFSYGGKDFEVKSANIHNLVKKFTRNLFKSYDINIQTGKINFEQFQEWIMNHKNLYDNYYKGFHNSNWELDYTGKLKFLSIKPEKKSLARLKVGDKLNKITLMLQHSMLTLCEGESSNPIMVICLQGLMVKRRTYDQQNGSGIQITHRDGIYPVKQIFFKTQQLTNQWMEYLKCYKGEFIQNLYDFGLRIGTGKFSVVYSAIEKQTGLKWAIKAIQTFKLDPQARQLIAHESSIMAVLNHPFLVAYKTTIQTKTKIYIITELVEGKDLFEYVKQNKCLGQREVALIAYQIIIGIKYLHSLGIVHRDLKPENIMISLSKDNPASIGMVKIIDFGFSNYLNSLRQFQPHDILVGTPNYIAPQILRNQVIDEKVDNFAIGAIIFFALSGSLPFNGLNIPQIFQKTLDGSYEYKQRTWKDISAEAKNLIDRLLQNDSQKRISLDQALKHPWLKFCSSFGKQNNNLATLDEDRRRKPSKKSIQLF